ncbi:hypothetical protein GGR74_003293 [Xanthomonas arboricola]|uniref:hypothetical protein n=1 Tax=Xanthomonas TaxID=338 RepID=UPI0011C44C30|nr:MULTISPECIES: hypothetical protein [Xanthomonas]MBB3777724.1 hypothetical protein [Xanthomonas euroxanthea]MBB3812901.1 hypothetical protein [Xanthomonas euroxanthea]CAD1786721.1 hypothetical protein XSP_000355 [Xanthomonas sp. CPBF 426]CAG2083358.1 hypothetical protein XCY_000354 [Xanthomonas euroxanthea]
MRRILLVLLATLIPATSFAGVPFEATLEEMAQGADHILIGRVTGVDMIDGRGRPIRDRKAMTGPGLKNTIRLLVAVDEVLITNAASVPKVLAVPLASHLHYNLGQITDAHAGDTTARLALLQKNFVGIKPGVFMRPVSDKDEALRIYHATHP